MYVPKLVQGFSSPSEYSNLSLPMGVFARGNLVEWSARPSQLAFDTLFSRPSPVPTMTPSHQPKGRDGVLSTLDVAIQALNLAKDSCGIPPAQIAFGSASVLLTMIRVRFLLLYEDGLLIGVYIGHDCQRSGLCRLRAGLRRCMSNPLQEIEGETIGPTQPIRPRRDWRADCVSQTVHAHPERSTYR
jgi:hypothetical protein